MRRKRDVIAANNVKKTVILGFVLQGCPYVMQQSEGDLLTWGSIDEGLSAARQLEVDGHNALRAAESVVVIDLDSGESETYR